MKRKGGSGSPCLSPRVAGKKPLGDPFSILEMCDDTISNVCNLTHFREENIFINGNLTRSKENLERIPRIPRKTI